MATSLPPHESRRLFKNSGRKFFRRRAINSASCPRDGLPALTNNPMETEMGLHYVNKLLLLDERELPLTPAAATFPELEAAVVAECSAEFEGAEDPEFEDTGFPEYELLGIASERFNRSSLHDGNYAEPTWLQDAGWDATVEDVFKWTGCGSHAQLDPHADGQQGFEDRMRSEILQHISAAQYGQAGDLCHALAGFQKSGGLPGFRDAYHMTTGGEDDLLDYRRQNHGPGQRILAEIAFVWD